MHCIAVKGGDPAEVWKVWTVRGCGDSCWVPPTAGDVVHRIAVKGGDPTMGGGVGRVWTVWKCGHSRRAPGNEAGGHADMLHIYSYLLGARAASMSPWPSFPNKPFPQVKRAPSSETAAVWYGPQETWCGGKCGREG